MEVRFVARGTEIDAGLKDYMESKMSKLEKFFSKILSSQVVVSFHKGNFNVETTANVNGLILRAEENAPNLRKAFDQSLKTLESRIKRHNSYLKDKAQFQSEVDFSFSLENVEETKETAGIDNPTIEKVKTVPLYPMDPKEAVMQMELVGHSFFVFQNGDTGEINVVYKRKDGNYGQLVPMK